MQVMSDVCDEPLTRTILPGRFASERQRASDECAKRLDSEIWLRHNKFPKLLEDQN
jgi:hypothetical protein